MREDSNDAIQANLDAQADEFEVLQAIYGEECESVPEEARLELVIKPPEHVEVGESSGLHILLRVLLPVLYPSRAPPIFEMEASWLPGSVLEGAAAELEKDFTPGEVVVYNWVEALRNNESLWASAVALAAEQAAEEEDAYAAVAARAAADEEEEEEEGRRMAESLAEELRVGADTCEVEAGGALGEMAQQIISGAPVVDRKSTFQAHVAPVRGAEDVEAFMEVLLRNRKIAAATHNILAYRIATDTGWLQDHDEDGETAAGGRLLHLLQVTGAEQVAVCVTRWYGGVKLGPDRFRIINNTARNMLEHLGYIGEGKSTGGKKGGKRR